MTYGWSERDLMGRITDEQGRQWVECDWSEATWLLTERRQRNPWKTVGVMIPVKPASANICSAGTRREKG